MSIGTRPGMSLYDPLKPATEQPDRETATAARCRQHQEKTSPPG